MLMIKIMLVLLICLVFAWITILCFVRKSDVLWKIILDIVVTILVISIAGVGFLVWRGSADPADDSQKGGIPETAVETQQEEIDGTSEEGNR